MGVVGLGCPPLLAPHWPHPLLSPPLSPSSSLPDNPLASVFSLLFCILSLVFFWNFPQLAMSPRSPFPSLSSSLSVSVSFPVFSLPSLLSVYIWICRCISVSLCVLSWLISLALSFSASVLVSLRLLFSFSLSLLHIALSLCHFSFSNSRSLTLSTFSALPPFLLCALCVLSGTSTFDYRQPLSIRAFHMCMCLLY